MRRPSPRWVLAVYVGLLFLVDAGFLAVGLSSDLQGGYPSLAFRWSPLLGVVAAILLAAALAARSRVVATLGLVVAAARAGVVVGVTFVAVAGGSGDLDSGAALAVAFEAVPVALAGLALAAVVVRALPGRVSVG